MDFIADFKDIKFVIFFYFFATCNLLLWGYVKGLVYVHPFHTNLEELKQRITDPLQTVTQDMLQHEEEYRIGVCCVSGEAHIEHFGTYLCGRAYDLWTVTDLSTMGWGKQGHAPCKTSSSKNTYGSQLLWATPVYHKNEGATPHPGPCKHSLQYYERPDGSLGVRAGTWNLGCLSGKRVEVCEELRKRMIDVCCLQEVRLRGQGARDERTEI